MDAGTLDPPDKPGGSAMLNATVSDRTPEVLIAPRSRPVARMPAVTDTDPPRRDPPTA